jgi:hypothetical protein
LSHRHCLLQEGCSPHAKDAVDEPGLVHLVKVGY